MIVTGVVTAAVQVAVTCVPCEAERCTEGSLTVQFEFTRAAVTAGHPELWLNWNEALKSWLLAGGAALWSTVAAVGLTFKPTGPQLGEPPQPASADNAAHNASDEIFFNGNTSSPPCGVLAGHPPSTSHVTYHPEMPNPLLLLRSMGIPYRSQHPYNDFGAAA